MTRISYYHVTINISILNTLEQLLTPENANFSKLFYRYQTLFPSELGILVEWLTCLSWRTSETESLFSGTYWEVWWDLLRLNIRVGFCYLGWFLLIHLLRTHTWNHWLSNISLPWIGPLKYTWVYGWPDCLPFWRGWGWGRRNLFYCGDIHAK